MKRRLLRILVSAGPTREYWDPVRFLSNESTGAMGVACVKEITRRGHRATLVNGPMTVRPPAGIRTVPVITTQQMLKELRRYWDRSDALIMTAAVSDFRPAQRMRSKIQRRAKERVVLPLLRNPDILKKMARGRGDRCLAGFSLETVKGIARGQEKLREKKLDLVVCNWIGKDRTPFGEKRTTAAILDRQGTVQWLKEASKTKVAAALVDKIEQMCYQRKQKGGVQ
ncbi:MAG: phosphopantothenoylcysteine decarboxylase [Candidatus Omnitrophica bacterium]|nr:phosphopantothenoylcysteine decarboxylase [Candidatus Omnitrophota bacterium]